MSLKKSEMPTEHPPETGPEVWNKLTRYFVRERLRLLDTRDECGLEEAQLDHSLLLNELPTDEQLERMFLQAQWQYPKFGEIIEDTQMALIDLMSTIPSREEEQLDELRTMRMALLKKLRAIRHDIRVWTRRGVPFSLSVELDDPEDLVGPYEYLADNFMEAKQMIEDIRVILEDIEHLAKQYSK